MATVLVVDDEAEVRAELVEYLEYRGYKVVEAENGADGMAVFETAPADVVITDIRMPKVDGHDFISQLRELAPAVPIVAITGQYSPTDLGKATKLRATVTLKKPFGLRELARHLERLLEPCEA